MSTSERLRAVVVEGLFGSHDYTINLDSTRPTVLTGSNGTGKSTILRLINAIARADIDTLANAPLNALRIDFESTHPFSLVRDRKTQTLALTWGEHSTLIDISWDSQLQTLPQWAREIINEFPDDVEDFMTEFMRHAPERVTYSEFAEVRDRLRDLSSKPRRMPPPDWFKDLQSQFAVLFISDQRLIVEPQRPGVLSSTSRRPPGPRRGSSRSGARRSIDHASSDIASRIQDADSKYARVSQEHDRTFPRDVVDAMRQSKSVSQSRVSKLVKDVDIERERLRSVGLLDRAERYDPKIEPSDLEDPRVRAVVARIMEANLKKLGVLGDLALRLTTYKEFLDRRFAPKSITLNRRLGVRIDLSEGGSIAPGDLSSGEQQMAVMAYEILFRTAPNTLVIIDEPEISLHVLWQDTLIEDLSQMGSASGLQFLMATHSPVILANHSELERSLDDLAR
ncbi:AAA family ATPase [Nocardioides sp. LML1-1-1.1]|uniref:AAA family ATPase n=1 Tax=Nocardioides sp. LML1-1-1.1 TaxID=3135248 RepID=UPI00341440D1